MKRTFMLIALIGSTTTFAGAQEPLSLTLEEAITRGLAASHRLAETVAQGDAADAAAAQSRAARIPQVAALAGYTRTNHVDTFGLLLPNNQLKVIYPDLPNNFRTRLDLQWPIFTAGRLDALEHAARIEVLASGDDLAATRADLRLEITRAYWALATAIESVSVVDESVAQVGAHLKDVRNQFDQGLLPPNDVSSVQAQESRERMLSIQTRTQREVAEAELARLIGVEPGMPLQPVSPLSPPTAVDLPVAALLEEARAARSDRAALVKRVLEAGEQARAAQATRWPTIAVAGGVDYANPNPNIFPRQSAWLESWQGSVNVQWSVFDGGRADADVARAAANRRGADERLADFDSTLAVEVRQRSAELASSRAAIAAGDDAVRSAVEARRVVSDRFAAGVATSTDVLDAQVAALQSELDRMQAVANARLAEARLIRAVGR